MFSHRRCLSLLGLLLLPLASPAQDDADASANMAPPELPVYEQPPIPGEGYLWTPGYWAWNAIYHDYYWVPGTWVEAPQAGLLWTPGYWSTAEGRFLWHLGYWGPTVGFYGGVNYGFGYVGSGFVGGHWEGGHLFYNTAVINVGSTHITNVYEDRTVINNGAVNRESYNGGMGGVQAKPSAAELAAEKEHHLPPTSAQAQQVATARLNPQLRESANHGNPPIAATARPGVFQGTGVAAAQRDLAHSTEHAGDAEPARAAAAAYAERRPVATEYAHPAEQSGSTHRTSVHTMTPALAAKSGPLARQSQHHDAVPRAAPAFRAAPAAKTVSEPHAAPAAHPAAAAARPAPAPHAEPEHKGPAQH